MRTVTHFDNCSKRTQVARWELALKVLEGMDEHTRLAHFNMNTWGSKTDCGTIACLAGHCALDKRFNRRGFKYSKPMLEYLADQRSPARVGAYVFTEEPEVFFGKEGYGDILLGAIRSYEAVTALVKDHIKYLKDRPHAP